MRVKKISLLFIIFMISFFTIHSSKTQAATISFTDVSSTNPAYGEIMYLVKLGVLEGSFENGKRVFKPTEQVTRGQAAKMVIVATGKTPLVVEKSSFTDIDVKTNAALSGYVEQAVQLGYFSEYSPGKFEPKIPLTRTEMSKVLSLAFNLNVDQTANLTIPFADVAKSDPYYKYISAIYYNGITNGTHNSTKYSANEPVTRAQFSSFVARAASDTYRLKLPVQDVSNTNPDPTKAIGKVFVSVDGLNIRSSATSTNQSNIVGKANTGKEFSVYEDQGYWLKVAYNGKMAFVAKEFTKTAEQLEQELEQEQEIELEQEVEQAEDNSNPQETETPDAEENNEEQPNEQPSTVGLATINDLVIREKNDAASKSLGKISRGTEVDVQSINGEWVEVSYNGIIGFIEKRFIRLKNTEDSPVKDRIIVLDPGHGGKDVGAINEISKTTEKSIVLKVTTLVKEKLTADGAIVQMTRIDDTYPSLDDRIKFAKDKYGEMFISIHVNSADNKSASGTETYYSVSSNVNEKEDQVLATNIKNQIVKNANMKDRGVKRADFKVIKGLTIPAVLVELGFIKNDQDHAKLIDDKYVEIFADSIYQGIVEYYAR
ncbi:N-acetylmuramoyl-L-alanine amidase [Solibacillus sp. MA9]|uniref:N-acetylmuramoyl-L-alanine amidase n=1 Tax=Solibacillus palustris TaxID=2908203 RepID=A0ABS9U9C1_9BACL|nr:N-acetylmuramoyl-L-alanine amidase [Solibacillus sp. MA9]